MNRDRFRFFQSTCHESDLLIGVPHNDFTDEMEKTSFDELFRLRNLLLNHIKKNPLFGTSLDPVEPEPGLPVEIDTMLSCARKSGTGPMSSVAGLFAGCVASRLITAFELDEVVVENGGDLYVRNKNNLISTIHAGTSSLSDKMAFLLTPGTWGVCTSSGTMGHSFSQGMADAVTVIAESAPLADAWATALANCVSVPGDIEAVLDRVSGIPEILGCAVILGDRIGVRGQFEVKLLS